MPRTKAFEEMYARVKRDYLGKPVPFELVKKYGYKYNKKDILKKAYELASKRGIQIEKFTVGKKEVYK